MTQRLLHFCRNIFWVAYISTEYKNCLRRMEQKTLNRGDDTKDLETVSYYIY